ncbi:uncharacterized protein OCT59_027666 [Rhizophagus irregularis]|uniref:MARVEL domain-containing protein n=1 Tax=Rhizophagus irregularis (strain DAOM 181602 / DAOM 197198 / MUCL 43194) TaxID=747089 RepID=A0A2H5RCH7_RHIID|nr:hypothetical protein GLOIN_2v1656378 [Rhizophagus irregularis DAOM 181602=DAOM 197198]POG66534.1 hypothetical protein GLOIN_2v1656378 [Rhizophagus irregularis DAOM 181602=DAOM 197198]UZO07381.1 hypothetical protein OCT59_027666 [Rhizophagus irregularis]GBC15796.1 hypothetical protein GLOIN_2v1656378 [Rhizophagus irregularis DAOM 181602=DAOM 197198]|eukprot:XP_025173400.1 hypothetical protein GLOIN_2v1656378 [Rhizophagus irregularis DAOM 181602=DAOM 197198]
MTKRPHINNCCFCIPLKSGVIIITLLWLIFGIYAIIDSSLGIATPNKVNALIYFKVQYIASIVFNALITFGAAFGLYVLTYANIPRMLSIYAKIAYVIVGINVISHILTAVVSVVFKADILKLCAELNANIIASVNEKSGACNEEYDDFLKSIIMSAVVSTLISVYFAIVIASYAQRRNEKEKETTAADAAETHLYEKTSKL